MPEIKIRSYVGEDGILHLDIPVDVTDTELEVTVKDEYLEEYLSQLEWHEFLEKTAGSINDDSFFRHPQGDYDIRDPLMMLLI